MARFILSQLI